MLVIPDEVAKQNNLRVDRRFNKWARVVRMDDVDLSQIGAYALGGRFVKFDAPAAVDEGEFLVVYVESGTRRYRTGRVVVATVEDGVFKVIDKDAILAAIGHPDIPDSMKEKAMRNQAYAAALYIRLRGESSVRST